MLGAPVDVVGEQVGVHQRALGDLHLLSRDSTQLRVRAVAHRLLVCLRDAEEHPDDAHRHLVRELRHQIERFDTDESVQATDAEISDLGSSEDTRRGVKTRDSNLRWMSWAGGSSISSVPGGISMFALITSRIGPREEENVFQSVSPSLHVLRPGQRIEVVPVVVVQRRLGPHPRISGVRIPRELPIERIPIDRTVAHSQPLTISMMRLAAGSLGADLAKFERLFKLEHPF